MGVGTSDSKSIPKMETETEEEWEARIVKEALGDALNPDGSIDFDKLFDRGIPMTLEELYPEGDADDELESLT